MRYRNFNTLPIEALPVGPAASQAVSAEALTEAEETTIFPLLQAALPEVLWFTTPQQPALQAGGSAKQPMLCPRPNAASLPLNKTALEERPIERSGDVPDLVLPATLSLPADQAASPHNPTPSVSSRRAGEAAMTPLAELFSILRAENLHGQDRTKTRSDLQNMFRRL